MEKQVIYTDLTGQNGEYAVKFLKRVIDWLYQQPVDEVLENIIADMEDARRIAIRNFTDEIVSLSLDGDDSYSIRISETHDGTRHRYYAFTLLHDGKVLTGGTVRHRL